RGLGDDPDQPLVEEGEDADDDLAPSQNRTALDVLDGLLAVDACEHEVLVGSARERAWVDARPSEDRLRAELPRAALGSAPSRPFSLVPRAVERADLAGDHADRPNDHRLRCRHGLLGAARDSLGTALRTLRGPRDEDVVPAGGAANRHVHPFGWLTPILIAS